VHAARELAIGVNNHLGLMRHGRSGAPVRRILEQRIEGTDVHFVDTQMRGKELGAARKASLW